MKNLIYPLRFTPTFHYRIWGGNGLTSHVGKAITEENIGESWEISTVPNFVSEVEDGIFAGSTLNDLLEKFAATPNLFLGTKVSHRFGKQFPILIKYIDAEAPLSVQVHPDDEFAKANHDSMGKTEMWYIMRAEEDAELIIGFKEGTTKALYEEKLAAGNLEEILHKVQPKVGEVYYIPAGRVHAIGKGITLAEIQQNSDVTYRIYDYNRTDKEGNKRALHTEKALEVSDFNYIEKVSTEYSKTLNTRNEVVNSSYFHTSYLNLDGAWEDHYESDSFTIYMGVQGHASFVFEDRLYSLNLGEVLLIPAGITEHRIIPKGNSEILQVRMV